MHTQKWSLHIIHSNLYRFYSRLKHMQLLVNNFQPQIICLQETNFNQNTREIKSYKTFNKHRNSRHTSGGVVTLIRSTIHSEEITITSNYEVIFTKIKINLYICNLYISNSQQLNESEANQPNTKTGDHSRITK